MEENNRIMLILLTPSQGMLINVGDDMGYHYTNKDVLVRYNMGPSIWLDRYKKVSTIKGLYKMFTWGKE